jgi:hypothetical protein
MASQLDFRVKNGLTVVQTATFASTVQAVSTTTGAVQITGGVGIGRDLWVGGSINVAGTINASVTGVITSATNIANGTAGQIPFQSAVGVTTFVGPGAAGQVLVSRGTNGPIFQNTLSLTSLTVAGPIFGQNIYANGDSFLGTVYNNTATGSKLTLRSILQTATLFSVNETTQNIVMALPMNNWSIVSTDGNFNRNVLSKDASNNINIGVSGSSFLNDINIYTGPSGAFNIYSGSAGYRSYFDNQGTLRITSSTSVSSPTTGALQVTGGAGFGSNVFVGGTLTATNVFIGAFPVSTGTALGLSFNGVSLGNVNAINFSTGTQVTVTSNSSTVWVNTATLMQYAVNVANGGSGALVYNPTPSTTAFLSTGTPGQMLLAAVGAPVWTSTSSIYVQGSRFTDNVRGGVAGGVVYQSAASTTAVTAAGSAGQVLISQGTSAPVWQNTMTLAGTVAATSTLTGAFQVAGGAGIGGSLFVGADSRFVSVTNASSTITGALQVAGGVGIGRNLYVGENFGLGTNVIFPIGGDRGVAFNENYNPSAGNTLQTNYHFASGAGDTASVLTWGVTGQHTNAIGTVGSASSNQFVFASTSSNTSFQFRNNVGIQPINLSAGSLLLDIATTGQVSIPTTIAANSTQSGSLVVAGGVGIGGNLHVGGVLFATVQGSINTATNLAGGVAGAVPYQSAVGTTAFSAAGSNGQILLSGGTGAPTWASTGTVYVNSSRFTDNVVGGTAGAIVYQTAANTTNFVALSGTQKSLLTAGASAPTYITQVQAQSGTGSVSSATSQSLVVTAGGLGVTGDSYFGNNVGVIGNQTITGTLRVDSPNANAGTNTSNAIYTAGGAWIDKTLVVAGPATFRDTVTFLGTATYIYSTNTVVTDSLINIHAPAGSTPEVHAWTVDDGRDIGHLYHYYKGTDKDGFLGLNNASTFLEWWENGTAIGNGFTGTNWGTFRTGAIKLVGGTPNTGNTSSGDLTVLGGAGFGGNVFIQGSLNVQGGVNAVINGTITTATNLSGGTAGQLVFQGATGLTSYAGPGTAGQILTSNGTSGPVYVNTATLLTGYAVDIVGGGNGALLFQPTPNDTQFLSTGTPGQLLSSAVGAPVFVSTSSLLVGFTVNDSGGAAGSLRFQSGANASTFLAIGAAGTFLTSSGTAPVWNSTATALIGFARNISGGTTGQLVYQSGASATAFVGPGTAGQVLLSGGVGAPVYTSTSSIYVNSSRFADNLTAGVGGSIPYQSAANTTAMLAIGSSGFVLQSNGSAPVWSPLSGISAGQATTATNLGFGTAGQVPYQTAPGATSFFGPGTAGQVLLSGGTGAPTYTNTSSIYVNSSVFSDRIRGGAVGSLVFQSAADTTSFLGLGVNGYFLTAGATGPQWSNTATALIGYAQNLAGGSAGQFVFQSGPNTTSFVNTGSMYVNSARFADELTGGAAGSIPYQVGANDTSFLAIGTNGFVLTSNGSAPTWAAISGLSAGSATTATNLAGGTTGQIPYQASAGSTTFFGPGTAGQLLQSGGAGAPSYVNTTSIYIGRSIFADDVFGGGNGSLLFQPTANDTQFLSTGTQGSILVSQPGAPVFTSTATFLVGFARNISAGSAGQLLFQSAASTTGFVGPGTAGQLLVSAGTSAPVYTNTSSISVGFSANLLGGAAGGLPYQTAANATGFVGIGTNGQVLTSNGSIPVWSAVSGLTAGNATNAANVFQTTDPVSTTYRILLGNGTNANAQVFNYSALFWNNATATIQGASISGNAATANFATSATSALSAGFLTNSAPQLASATESNSVFISAPSYTTDSPVKLLNFDWYGNIFSMGNIRSGATPTNGFGFYYTPSSGSRTELARFTPSGAISFGASGTAFGTSGQVLQSNGNASPTWVNVSGIGAGSATTASQVLTVLRTTNADHFLTFVDSNNATATGESVYTLSAALSVNPSTGLFRADKISTRRDAGAAAGISWYSPTYSAWTTYMSPAGATGAGPIANITAPSGTLVTSWALRDFVENATGYGWTFESGTANQVTPTVVAEIRASDGAARFGGTIQSGASFIAGTGVSAGYYQDATNGAYRSIVASSTLNGYYFQTNGGGATTMFVGLGGTVNGRVGVGTASPATALHVVGEIVATSEVTAYYSDRRLKENVKTIDNAVEKVLKLNGITYNPNALAESFGFERDVDVVGLFADEVEAVLPQAVKPAPFDQDGEGGSKSGENYKTVQYEKVVPLLVEAIKEQQKQIAQLTEMVKLLTNK